MSVLPHQSVPEFPTRGISHGFFGRRGGVSTGIYHSLNAGPGSLDDPTHVSRNRNAIAASLGLSEIVSCYQVHGRDVVDVQSVFNERPKADAMVTNQAGIGLCILTADCVPVLFADAEAGIVGAAHAGWKGAIAGVCEATIDAMQAKGADVAHIHAAIGPAIQQASYEVGPEFRDRFLQDSQDSERFFRAGLSDRWLFDLTGYVAARLRRTGIAHVSRLLDDTYGLEGMYYSNRRRVHRGEPDYGRNAAVVALKTSVD